MTLKKLHNFENGILVKLYKTYSRPYLDYNSVIFYPYYLELIDTLEHVLRHWAKRLHGLNKLSYGNWLNIVGLESAEQHSKHADLIVLYKFLHKNIERNVGPM